jgi:hypothetical protein
VPFRGVVKDMYPGKPVQILVAGPDDAEVRIAIKPYGAVGVSGGPNFWVGGPDIKKELGMLVSSNELTTSLEPGDDVWVMAAEALPFAEYWQITALIRSRPRQDGNEGKDDTQRAVKPPPRRAGHGKAAAA